MLNIPTWLAIASVGLSLVLHAENASHPAPPATAEHDVVENGKLLPADLIRRVAHINGQQGVVTYHRGHPHVVLTIDVVDGRIENIHIVSNPDKLTGLPCLPAGPLLNYR
jgi:hypothetical protein